MMENCLKRPKRKSFRRYHPQKLKALKNILQMFSVIKLVVVFFVQFLLSAPNNKQPGVILRRQDEESLAITNLG
jgi:hypothetical protein